eukprot:COSAG02_NODE_5802_length_4026_cov_4.072320_3_plen_65_part_00
MEAIGPHHRVANRRSKDTFFKELSTEGLSKFFVPKHDLQCHNAMSDTIRYVRYMPPAVVLLVQT